MKRRLGPFNDFASQLEGTRFRDTILGTQNYHSVEEGAGIVRAAVRTIRSEATLAAAPVAAVARWPLSWRRE